MTVRLDCITLNCLITTLIFSFQRNIQRIKDLVRMEEEDRRALLRTLSDDEYRDVMNVCATMPNIEMTIKSEGITVFFYNHDSCMGKNAFVFSKCEVCHNSKHSLQ